MNRLKKGTAKNILLYLFVFWALYVSDSMLFALNNNRAIMRYASWSLTLVGIALGMTFIVKRKIKIDFTYLLIAAVFFVLSGLYNSNSVAISVKRIATLFIGYFMAKKIDTKKLIDAFCNVMVFIAAISLVGYVFPDFFASLSFLPRIITSTREMESASLFFTNIPLNSWNSARNWGPFWEPGAYQAFLNLALMFTLFLRSKELKHWWFHVLILVTAVISTLSTTGYTALAAIYVAYVLNKPHVAKKIQLSRIAILFVGIAVIAFIFGESGLYESVIVEKLSNTESSRFLFVKYGIRVFADSPIFGNGAALARNMENLAGTSVSFTNTLVANFAVFGLIPGAYVLVRYIKSGMSIRKLVSLPTMIFLVIALFVLLFGEYFMYSPTFAWLMYIDYGEYEKCKTKEPCKSN